VRKPLVISVSALALALGVAACGGSDDKSSTSSSPPATPAESAAPSEGGQLNLQQTYSVTRQELKDGKVTSSKTIAKGIPVAPDNVGPRTFPDYDKVANQAISSLPGGGKVFVGQREDPFFVDLGGTFDALNIRNGTGNAGGGKDDLAGYNVHSIVLQVPQKDVTVDGQGVSGPTAKNAVVGVWASTERQKLQVTNEQKSGSGGWVQTSRLGNPLINELIIPLGEKDKFNRSTPDQDAKLFGSYVLSPEPAKLLNGLFKVGAPENNRTDIVQALLTGIPGKTQIGTKPAAADTLKINLGVPPAANPNRFGVLAGDLAGFPDGRRLGDDVVDIELRVVGGFLKGHKLPLGDGVDHNDRAYLSTFPYVAPPFPGLQAQLKKTQPTHPGTPGYAQT
jgi:hypothetical protein